MNVGSSNHYNDVLSSGDPAINHHHPKPVAATAATVITSVAAAPNNDNLYDTLLRYHNENDSYSSDDSELRRRRRRGGEAVSPTRKNNQKAPSEYVKSVADDEDEDRKLPAQPINNNNRKSPPSASLGDPRYLRQSEALDTSTGPRPPSRFGMNNNADGTGWSSFYQAALEESVQLEQEQELNASSSSLKKPLSPVPTTRPGVVHVHEPVVRPDSAMYRLAFGGESQQRQQPDIPNLAPSISVHEIQGAVAAVRLSRRDHQESPHRQRQLSVDEDFTYSDDDEDDEPHIPTTNNRITPQRVVQAAPVRERSTSPFGFRKNVRERSRSPFGFRNSRLPPPQQQPQQQQQQLANNSNHSPVPHHPQLNPANLNANNNMRLSIDSSPARPRLFSTGSGQKQYQQAQPPPPPQPITRAISAGRSIPSQMLELGSDEHIFKGSIKGRSTSAPRNPSPKRVPGAKALFGLLPKTGSGRGQKGEAEPTCASANTRPAEMNNNSNMWYPQMTSSNHSSVTPDYNMMHTPPLTPTTFGGSYSTPLTATSGTPRRAASTPINPAPPPPLQRRSTSGSGASLQMSVVQLIDDDNSEGMDEELRLALEISKQDTGGHPPRPPPMETSSSPIGPPRLTTPTNSFGGDSVGTSPHHHPSYRPSPMVGQSPRQAPPIVAHSPRQAPPMAAHSSRQAPQMAATSPRQAPPMARNSSLPSPLPAHSSRQSSFGEDAIALAESNAGCSFQDVLLALKLSAEESGAAAAEDACNGHGGGDGGNLVATSFDELLAFEMVTDYNQPMTDYVAAGISTTMAADNHQPHHSHEPSADLEEQLRILERIREEQEQMELELALKASQEEQRSATRSNSRGHSQGTTAAGSQDRTKNPALDFLLSQQEAMEEWSRNSQQQKAATRTLPNRVPVRQNSESSIDSAGRRRELLERGTRETQQAISSGQAHIVTCRGCNGRLQAPVSYSLVFCPKCQTISPA